MNRFVYFVLFIVEILSIYFLAHYLLTISFHLMRKLFHSDTAIIWIIAMLYLPGTILHEISHYFFALLLIMNPEEVSILPRIDGDHIRLGHVLYRKHHSEFVRPIIVGIAPFFGAIGLLWVIQLFHLFPSVLWWQTIVFGYLILAITANMFSSKQDLVDLIYIVPIFLIVGAVIYIFQIQIKPEVVLQIITAFDSFFKTIQIPLLFSIIVHSILIVIIKVILSFV